MTSSSPATPFGALARSSTAILTTFRSSGEGVATPVSIALVDGVVYFATPADSGKAKRLAGSGRVTVAPSTVGGVALGAPVSGRARLLEGAARRPAQRLLRPWRALFWSYLTYRVRGNSMNLYVVVPDPTP